MEDRLKRRRGFFRNAVSVLEYLEKEMMQRRVAMTESLYEASHIVDDPWKRILCELSECVRKYTGNTFTELWEEIIKQNLSKEFLRDAEWQVLLRIPAALSGTDTEIQQTLIKSCLEHMKELEQKAAEEYETRGMLYRRLSVLAAAFLVLILI